MSYGRLALRFHRTATDRLATDRCVQVVCMISGGTRKDPADELNETATSQLSSGAQTRMAMDHCESENQPGSP